MNRAPSSSAGVSTPAALLSVAALAVVVAIAFNVAGNRGPAAPGDAPTPVVTPAPSAPATPVVTPAPTQPATPAPSAGVDGAEIPLDDANGNDVVLGISDREGLLDGAVSGDAGDGMSVRWGDSIVRNLDAKTIEVTFVSFPQEPFITLVVKAEADGVLLRFGQNAPVPNSDALGADRVVVLTFAEPVSAADVITDFTTADD